MFINLLPQKTRVKIQFRSMFRSYALAWGLGGVGMAVGAALQASHLWRASDELALLESRCQPIDALQDEIARNQQELKLVQTQLTKLGGLQPANHFIDLMAVLIEATRAESGRLYIQRLALLSGQTPQVSPGAKPPASKTTASTLSLGGIAEDDAVVTHFVTTLRNSGVFEHVDLKSSSPVVGGSRFARQYQLECRYQDVP